MKARRAATAAGVAADATRPLRCGWLPLIVTLALVVAPIAGCAGLGSDSFCTAIGSGRTPVDAARNYVGECGGDYRITRGPYDADKKTTPFANYAQVTEFTISVANNSEGSLGFLVVGRRTRHQPWRTLEPLGTGP